LSAPQIEHQKITDFVLLNKQCALQSSVAIVYH
jgi:hypothetical protein